MRSRNRSFIKVKKKKEIGRKCNVTGRTEQNERNINKYSNNGKICSVCVHIHKVPVYDTIRVFVFEKLKK